MTYKFQAFGDQVTYGEEYDPKLAVNLLLIVLP